MTRRAIRVRHVMNGLTSAVHEWLGRVYRSCAGNSRAPASFHSRTMMNYEECDPTNPRCQPCTLYLAPITHVNPITIGKIILAQFADLELVATFL